MGALSDPRDWSAGRLLGKLGTGWGEPDGLHIPAGSSLGGLVTPAGVTDNPLLGWVGAAAAVGWADWVAVGAAATTAVGAGAGVGVAPPHAATVTARPISARILNLNMAFSFLRNLYNVAEYNTNTIAEQPAPGVAGCPPTLGAWNEMAGRAARFML